MCCCLSAAWLVCPSHTGIAAKSQIVLFIVADEMNNDLGC